jgi:DNA (cytosine-5)-methyltransferase 1
VRPRLLDLFCGAGGAAVGYHRAGFDVVGVDIEPQPNYPFRFEQEDALLWLRRYLYSSKRWRVDAIHASPPCQNYSATRHLNRALGRLSRHSSLIDKTRDLLVATGLPYVIENVVGAPLVSPIKLCGSSFGLRVRRHRLFESNVLLLTRDCEHRGSPHRSWDFIGVYGSSPGGQMGGGDGYDRTPRAQTLEEAQEAMGIDWMTWDELREAIPPAYTELVGHQLMQHLEVALAG